MTNAPLISNAFVKEGFPDPTNKGSNESQPDETKEEDFSGNIEFDHPEFNGHEYVECDKDVVTSRILTISHLIICYDSRDDEEDDPTDSVPSSKEVFESLKTVKSFLSVNVNQQLNLQKLADIENAVYDIVFKNKKQGKITYYFLNNKVSAVSFVFILMY